MVGAEFDSIVRLEEAGLWISGCQGMRDERRWTVRVGSSNPRKSQDGQSQNGKSQKPGRVLRHSARSTHLIHLAFCQPGLVTTSLVSPHVNSDSLTETALLNSYSLQPSTLTCASLVAITRNQEPGTLLPGALRLIDLKGY